ADEAPRGVRDAVDLDLVAQAHGLEAEARHADEEEERQGIVVAAEAQPRRLLRKFRLVQLSGSLDVAAVEQEARAEQEQHAEGVEDRLVEQVRAAVEERELAV